jgi:hypothetical protein
MADEAVIDLTGSETPEAEAQTSEAQDNTSESTEKSTEEKAGEEKVASESKSVEPERVSRPEKRIKSLIRKLGEESKARQDLEAKFKALESGKAIAADAEAAPDISKYSTVEDYQKDLSKYHANQQVNQILKTVVENNSRQEWDKRISKADENFSNQVLEAEGKYDDFDEADVEDIKSALPIELFFSIKENPQAGDLLYHMTKNPAAVSSIAAKVKTYANGSKDFSQAFFELGKISAGLSKKEIKKSPPTSPKVGAAGGNLNGDSLSDYMKRRAKKYANSTK